MQSPGSEKTGPPQNLSEEFDDKPRRLSDDRATPSALAASDHVARKPDPEGFGDNIPLQSLHAPHAGGPHVSSPDTLSIISMKDYPFLRTGRSPTAYLSVPVQQRHASISPAPLPARTWSAWLAAFWTRNKGLALVLVSQVFGTLMNVTTRILEIEGNHGKGMHPFQILFARMSITLAMSSLYVWWKKIENAPFGPSEVRWLLVLRGFGGFFGVFGMYYSLLYLPLADATVITFLAPSLACFACSFLIKEPFTRMEKIGTLISLIGVILIARPTSLFSNSSSSAPLGSGDGDLAPIPPNITSPAPTSDAGNYDDVTPGQRLLAVAVALTGVVGAACAYTTLRWIGPRAHALISVNYFAAWSTLVSVLAMTLIPSVHFLLPSTARDWSLLALLGTCGFVMQFLLASGLQYERSSRATNMVYAQMLFALAGDKVVFGTSPDAWGWAGSCLILGSAVYVAVQKEQRMGNGKEVLDEERGLMDGVDDADEVFAEEEEGERERGREVPEG